ncbi:MAG: DUF485 domain-containing protein [Gammaproteobacteria bacterium]
MHDTTTLIDRDPRFHALQRARSRFAWGLAALVFVAFYTFMGVTAFQPAWLARPLHAETSITVGLAAGSGIIVFCILLTGVYVWRANREFDRLNRQILDDATRHAR